MSRRRRFARWILIALVMVSGLLGFSMREPLYWWATTRRVYYEEPRQGSRVRGWVSFRRGEASEHGRSVAYWYPSGLLAYENLHRDGQLIQETDYDRNGVVLSQHRPSRKTRPRIGPGPRVVLNSRDVHRREPPWFDETADGPRPRAPAWLLDDARWQAVLEVQRLR